jgi:hypothetical protein
MNETTLGTSLFEDPLAGGSDLTAIRQRLELKAAAVVTTQAGFAGWPPHINRFKIEPLRCLIACGMILKKWSPMDLIRLTGRLELARDSVLLATLEKPRWGRHDFLLMERLEQMENLRTLAWRGGNAL